MKKPYTIVAIPFKGQIGLLRDAVFSILDNYVSGMNYAIFCWDDGSTNQELDELYNIIPKQILIVRHDNVGYTKAVYNIVDYCKNDSRIDYLLLCNSDIRMRKGSFYSLVSRMLTNPNIGAVGGKIIKYGTNIIQHTGTIVDPSCENSIENPHCGLLCDDPKSNFVERRLWVNGCCTLYNMSVLRGLNLNFDVENFSPAYFEESDLQSKMNLMGNPVIYEPRAEIEHHMNSTMGQERDKYGKIFWTNWQKYLDIWKDRLDTLPQFKFIN